LTPSLYGAAGIGRAPYLRADLTDYGQAVATVAAAKADVVIHAAGIPEPSHDAQHVIFANNVLSTFNVCEAVAQQSVSRFIYLSSETVPGFITATPVAVPDYLPVDEKHPIRPHEAYAMSKYFGELMGDALTRRADVSVVSIRASFVVGADEYAGLLKQLREKGPEPFDNQWSYVDIDDLADLVTLAALGTTEGHEVLYAAQPDNFMNRPLTDLVSSVYGDSAPPVGTLSRPDASAIDSTKARTMFGWRPTRSWRGE
jgi:nucleoside-diphosphate-sugar epimerase